MRLRLDKPIGDLCEAVVRRAASALSSGGARVPHRSRSAGPVGGRLLQALRRPKKLVKRARWGAVITWHVLGQTFLYLTKGTKRQKARPVELAPSEKEIRAAVVPVAAKHFRRRDRRKGGRR